MQQVQWRTTNEHLVIKAYDALNHSLSVADIGGFFLAIVELRCLDVVHNQSTYSRVGFVLCSSSEAVCK
jgi:hypothetical protein